MTKLKLGDYFTFSGGEVHVNKQIPHSAGEHVVVEAYVKSSDDLMALLMLNEIATRRLCPTIKQLVLPYMPYARQDRVCAPGDALAAKVACDLINSMGFDRVQISDPHSDVVGALINNCHIIPQHDLISREVVKKLRDGAILVSPDAGAEKKTAAICKVWGLDTYIKATKHRCTKTGNILETTVDACNLEGQDVVIVDDICDGGRTFIELAKVLKAKHNCGNIHLHVTHGIFSKGKEVFNLFDEVTATYDWTLS
jgi:ribose-phosphate pyrophosphokinase